MVQCEAPVIKVPVGRRRVGWIIQARSHPPGHIKAAGYPDRADRIQPVGVLDDAGLDRLRRDSGGEAVCLDCMRGGVDPRRVPAQFCQYGARPRCRQARRLRAER